MKTKHETKNTTIEEPQEPTFKVDDKVWVLNRKKKRNENRKMYPKWVGPLIIQSQCRHSQFKLRWVSTEKLIKNTICGDHSKRYVDSEYKPYLNKEEQELCRAQLATSPSESPNQRTTDINKNRK